MSNFRPTGKPIEGTTYTWREAAVTVDDGTAPATLLTAKTGFDNIFSPFTYGMAFNVTIQTSGTAYFRLNSVTADPIKVTATTPLVLTDFECTSIYVSTNNVAITITLLLT